MERVEANLSE